VSRENKIHENSIKMPVHFKCLEQVVLDVLVYLNKHKHIPFNHNEILALIYCESCGDRFAETLSSRGLMQISYLCFIDVRHNFPELLQGISYKDMFDVKPNILVGTLYLSLTYDRLIMNEVYTYTKLWSVVAYNWGIGRVLEFLKIQPCTLNIFEVIPVETQRHLWKYLTYLTYFETLDLKEVSE